MSSVVSDSQISLKWCRRHLLAAMQFAVSCCELYFARRCAVNWTGTFASESKVMCSVCDFFAFLNISQCVKDFLPMRKVEFIE